MQNFQSPQKSKGVTEIVTSNGMTYTKKKSDKLDPQKEPRLDKSILGYGFRCLTLYCGVKQAKEWTDINIEEAWEITAHYTS